MTEDQDNLARASAKAGASKASHENRRRLLKAAAIAAPLMITLRGKSAHAQLSALGSIDLGNGARIMYGPGAYVVEAETTNGTGTIDPSWIGSPKNANGILKDPNRRGLQTDVVADPTKPKPKGP